MGRWLAIGTRKATDDEELVAAKLRCLLGRYGFLSREILDHDTMALRWADAYPVLSRMEWRGEVDRGAFVSGLSGPQFSLPGVAEELGRAGEGAELRLLHATDPAFVAPDVSAGEGLPRRSPGSYAVVRDGRTVLAIEAHGARLTPLVEQTTEERRRALALLSRLVRRAGQRPSIRVETWAGVAAASSEVAVDLAALGFLRDDQAMVLYRQYGSAT